MRNVIAGLIEAGLDPKDVGRMVKDAVLEGRFYVLTHPNWKNTIKNRMENILGERDPTGVPPEGAAGDWPIDRD